MVRRTPWLATTGVGPDGRPLPDDVISIAEQQAELERLAQHAETTLQLAKSEIPVDKLHNLSIKLTTKMHKVKT
jgi:hypothetical protein